jgi:UDP-glucose 4-epimerase
MKALVTGVAGFIGSNLADTLLARGWTVTGLDNFSTGRRRFLEGALRQPQFRLVEAELLDLAPHHEHFRGVDVVFHLAANADVRFGPDHPRRDLEQNTIATANVLEAMRIEGVKTICFSSTGSVYGETEVVPTPENAPFPVQTSLYGASKVAAEGLIAAYCEAFGMRGCVYRFVSVLGERYTHGHVIDFLRKLRQDPTRLPVLGNGRQRKSYLYVGDCVEGVLTGLERGSGRYNVFNLGTDEYCEVNDSIRVISEHLGVQPVIEYGGGDRGWVGDNPFIYLDCSRIRALGWRPQLTIAEGVQRTIEYLQANPSLLEPEDAQ